MFNSASEFNAMSPSYIEKLELMIWKTIIRIQKIDGSALETFEMMIADFELENKVGRLKFFQETFLIANTKFKMFLKIFFLKINNINMSFSKKTLTKKTYTTNKILSNTKQVQIVNPKKFIIATLDTDNKTFMVHMAIQKSEEISMNLVKKAQIEDKNRA